MAGTLAKKFKIICSDLVLDPKDVVAVYPAEHIEGYRIMLKGMTRAEDGILVDESYAKELVEKYLETKEEEK